MDATNVVITVCVRCPYCGEQFDTTVDLSAGDQRYIEDCYVCCQPIEFSAALDHNGELGSLEARRDNE